jgi:hypothetical protein
MANQRAAGQTMVGFWADEDFTAKIDAARGGVPRSQWLRDVIAEHLVQRGFRVTSEETRAPDRKGKGGPRKPVLVSSVVDVVAKEALKRASGAAQKRGPK